MTPSTRPRDTALISTKEAVRQAGVSYRQADYWLRTGIITLSDGPAQPGYGNPRRWAEDDVAVLRALGQASAAFNGLLHRDLLTAVADGMRELIRNGWLGDPVTLDLSPTVQVTIETGDA